MIRIAPVNYTNTYPLLMHLDEMVADGSIKVESMIPSAIPHALQNGMIDLGLAPVGGLSMLDNYYEVGDYGIATEGEVASVCLFSDVPVERLKTVYLDYQSRTSVKLLKWLFENYFDQEVAYLNTTDDGYIDQIAGETGGLVIGDRAFDLLGTKKYVYDLGAAWKVATGLPFVFALWVSQKKLPEDFISRFDSLQARGVGDVDAVIKSHNLEEYKYDMYRYYTENISYKLGDEHRRSIRKFLEETRYYLFS